MAKEKLSKRIFRAVGETALAVANSGTFLIWGKPKQSPKMK